MGFMTDPLVIAGRSFRSRLIVGTGKEGDHPAHGEGASESPMYLGLGGYTNLSVSNTFARTVTVDSGASGSYEIGVRFRQRGQQRCAAPSRSRFRRNPGPTQTPPHSR
jgi:hypothetical protein